MFVKKKHIGVIIWSSAIIAVVLISTVIGYNIYIEWKEDMSMAKYNRTMYGMTAGLFRKDINISNVKIVMDSDTIASNVPILEGSIKNNTEKIVTSVLMEISFLGSDETVVYRNEFHPLGGETRKEFFGSPNPFAFMRKTRNVLLPGEGISFRHFLSNCSKELVARATGTGNYVKTAAGDKLEFTYSIIGLSVI